MTTKTGTYEVHIAIPLTLDDLADQVISELRMIGIPKSKFFIEIYNVPQTAEYQHQCFTPPTGHDLESPAWMSTAKTTKYEDAKRLVISGMKVLTKYGIKGNFEIEQVIDAETREQEIEIEQDFPEFQKVKDSPEYENHIIWKGKNAEIPTYDAIVEAIRTTLSITVHQIVDFAGTKDLTNDTLVSRVATVYQPSRAEALLFAQRFFEKGDVLNHRYIVTEKVCLVGEYK